MICQGRPLVVVSLGLALVFFWCIRIFDLRHVVGNIMFEYYRPQAEQHFIQKAVQVEFPAPIDYRPIQEVCARTQFRSGLVFTCEGQHGGVGMVRNQILKCVRYAIHAGAALVVPTMALRNASDIADIETETEVPLDYLMDSRVFVKHLVKGCPGMQVYERAEDFPFYERRVQPALSLVGDQFEPHHPPEGLQQPRMWRRYFDSWLAQQNIAVHPTVPVHVRVGQAFLEYPVQDDGAAFVSEFGKILSFRNDTRELAAHVLWELKRRFALSIDPTKPLHPDAYYGAHLRLEDDAVRAWPPAEWRFSRMDDQFGAHIAHIEATGLRVVYVASGNATVVDLFAAALAARPGHAQRPVAVVTKHDLLRGAARARLRALSFDQQALVDFLVLARASAFMGVASSSFPWTVALRRHELSTYPGLRNLGSDLLRDELSAIMGMAADYPDVDPFATGLWP